NAQGQLTAAANAPIAIDASQVTTGTLPIARGGTGSATQTWVDLTTDQTIAGIKTFTPSVATSTGVVVKQAAGGTVDVFNVQNNAGTTKFFKIDSAGNGTFSGSVAAGSFSGSGASLT